jgi:uncharacterized protein YcbX
MTVVGKVESLWRYPVKSMRGEEIKQIIQKFRGTHGYRRTARASRRECASLVSPHARECSGKS